MKRVAKLAVPASLVITAAAVVMPSETLTEASAATLSPMLPSSAAAAIAPATSVPSGAVFVASNGSDSNTGKQNSPFKTLQRASKSVPSGGTIIVRGGVYRQGVSDPTSLKYGGLGTAYTSFPANVTIQNYPGEAVWFDGTEVASGFAKVSNTNFTKSWSVPGMCDGLAYTRPFSSQTASGPCSYSDALGSGASVGDPIMVFRNGTNLTEVTSAAQLGDNKFWYDQNAKVIHLGFNPSGSTVEITRRAQALALLHPSGLTIRGLGFRRYASNQYTNATQGAVLVNGGSNVMFERTAMTQNAGAGLVAWKTVNLTVRSSYLSQNGFNGMFFSGSKTSTNNLVIEYSRLDANNQDRYAVNCNYACSAAGVKATGTVGMIARYNSFSYNTGNRGSGIWCDEGCKGARIYGNQVIGNDRHGIVYEISDDAIIFSNLVKDNARVGGYGEGMMLGSSNVRVYNNTLINNYNQVLIYDDARDTRAAFAPNTQNISFANNIISGGGAGRIMVNLRGGPASPAANTTPSYFMRTFDYNSYHQPSGTTRALYNWQERPSSNQLLNSVPAMTAAHKVESHSLAAMTTANPYLSSGFTASGAAVHSGAALPSDVAALIGVRAGVAVNRGVLTLGGTPVGVTSTTAPAATPTTTTTTSSVIAKDTFNRTVAAGFGKADQGGSWIASTTSGQSVTNGAGQLVLAKGQTLTSSLLAANQTRGDVQVTANIGAVTGTQGQTIWVSPRQISTGNEYRAKVYISNTGSANLSVWAVAGGVYTQVGSTVSLPSITTGKTVVIRVQAVGTKSTALHAKAWLNGTAEPNWQVNGTNNATSLQAAGHPMLAATLSSSATVKATVRFDNLTFKTV